MSLPSSTMEIRWPIAGEGYKTMASIETDQNLSFF